jgi:hypothetical protein
MAWTNVVLVWKILCVCVCVCRKCAIVIGI